MLYSATIHTFYRLKALPRVGGSMFQLILCKINYKGYIVYNLLSTGRMSILDVAGQVPIIMFISQSFSIKWNSTRARSVFSSSLWAWREIHSITNILTCFLKEHQYPLCYCQWHVGVHPAWTSVGVQFLLHTALAFIAFYAIYAVFTIECITKQSTCEWRRWLRLLHNKTNNLSMTSLYPEP